MCRALDNPKKLSNREHSRGESIQTSQRSAAAEYYGKLWTLWGEQATHKSDSDIAGTTIDNIGSRAEAAHRSN
jgi:hypothetical protein